MMDKQKLLLTICLFGGYFITAISADEKPRPNVLMLLVDDLKPALGCYGDPIAKTPNIDRLASISLKFENAYCNQAVCAPSRFTLMLGSHSTSTGLFGLGSQLREVVPDAVTLPQYFARQGGYRTESLGKVFHIGHGNYGDPESFGVPHFHDKVIEYVDPASKNGDEVTREEAFFENKRLGPIKNLPRGAVFESPDVADEKYADGRVAAETMQRLQAAKIRRQDEGTPFFIVAGFARPHLPFSAPKKYWDLYDPAQLPMPQHDELPQGAPTVAGKRGGEITNFKPVPEKGDISPELARQLIHGYYASVSFVDAQIGKVLDELDHLQLTENTIIVLWGDHGFHLGDLGIWTKHTNYEQATRIPIIIHAPGVTTAGSTSQQLAESVDLFPTLAELAGLPQPKTPQPIDGLSLVPVLKDPSVRVRDHAYHVYPKSKLGRAIRTARYRMVEWHKPGEPIESAEYELYDYESDPLETENLAAKYPNVVEQLKLKLADYPPPTTGNRITRVENSHALLANSQVQTTTPEIANRPVAVTARVQNVQGDGVIVAQGGREHGYAVHIHQGKLAFDVRVNGKVTRAISEQVVPATFNVMAKFDANKMKLLLNEHVVAEAASPGLIPVQPKDVLSVGFDTLSAAGDYEAPNQLQAKIIQLQVTTGQPHKQPQVPAKADSTKPFPSELITQWGAEVTPENAWTEYPRPQMQRKNWTNLNGNWDYTITSEQQRNTPQQWTGQILVPFCLESKLGGVQRLLDPSEALWYRRKFSAKPQPGQKTLLNFEAVDYRCEVFVNGTSVGQHVGGNTPFSLDVTDALQDGENELIVRVEDETEAWQLRGKQVLNAKGIWYTQVSGIWQTVWLETVSDQYIQDLKISTDADHGTISIKPVVAGKGQLEFSIKNATGHYNTNFVNGTALLKLKNPQLWSPANPHLYQIEISLKAADGQLLDRVETYAGIRTVGKVKDADGHWRFTLNGEVIFHWGPLDQGWWPDGLLTPPSDEAMLFDIEWLKSAGFNMIRKHIKVEPRRYYYHCDRLGMLVWQDQVSGGQNNKQAWPEWTRLKPNPVDAVWPEPQHEQFMLELERMIATLENHPSIVCWVPFNERWGQHQTVEVGEWTVNRDPSRLVNVASGGNFWPVGDIVDAHHYPHPEFPFADGNEKRFDDFIKVMGEFGGHGYPVQGHLWDANRRNWGYGGLPQNEAEYKERYLTSLEMLDTLRRQGIAGGVYTQSTDVEGEINGLMTYDRKVIKIPAAELAGLHQVLFTAVDQKPADQFSKSAFVEQKTDRKPGPVMDAATIRSGLESHDRALFIKAGWIRDPYITTGPDGYYYLTGTQPNENDPREAENPYNIGLGDESIVGHQVRAYRSQDLIEWESLGVIFDLSDTYPAQEGQKKNGKHIWAPEVHWVASLNRWALVHCPKNVASLAVSAVPELKGPWTHPMQNRLGQRHDPSLFLDENGTHYLLWGNTMLAPLNADFTDYTATPVRIDPAGSRPGPDGQPISRIGHEGATMIKVGGKYVHLGTAWSTDQGRKGSYNLYYCVADNIAGPYGPRQFAGRFLGHGTPFQDHLGRWWCTAFFNANVPPVSVENIQSNDLSADAHTINEQGVTIVPLDVKQLESGKIWIRAKDPAYATPGPDEAQQF